MDGGTEKEVTKKIQEGPGAWKKVTGILCSKNAPPSKRKGETPAILHGMETVGVTKKQERKIEVAEMRILRYSLGKTRMDKMWNEVIRNEGGVKK